MAAQGTAGQKKQPITIDQAVALPKAVAHAPDAPSAPHPYNPKAWVFNPQTNNFHRVMGQRSGHYLLDPTVHEERLREYLIEEHTISAQWRIAALFGIVGVLSFIGSNFLPSDLQGLVSIAFGWGGIIIASLCAVSLFFTQKVTLPKKLGEVGPPPPPRPSREMVERQKVHGDGGVLGGDRLRQAARGGSLANEGARPLDTYDD